MNSYQTTLDWLATQAQTMEQTLLGWSAINSGSQHLPGLAQMAETLQQAFSVLNVDLESIPVKPMQRLGRSGNVEQFELGNVLRARKRPDAPLQVLLCGHMDTVFDENHPFQTTQYLKDGILNGPGVADMKGGLLVMLYALQALEQSPFADKIGWEVLINADEEIGSEGSAPFLAESGKRNHCGFVFEPAMLDDGTLAGARKGTGNFAVAAHGRASHAGRAPELGRNAIRALAEFICQADDLNQQRQGITVTVGNIKGGGATNIIPDLALCWIDVRTQVAEDEAWLLNAFETIINDINQKEGIRLELHGSFSRKPKPQEGKTLKLFEFVAKVSEQLGRPLGWQPSGGCCDGNNLAAVGLPVVDTLGVRGGKIHSSDEYIILESLVERAQLTSLILMQLAAGEFVL